MAEERNEGDDCEEETGTVTRKGSSKQQTCNNMVKAKAGRIGPANRVLRQVTRNRHCTDGDCSNKTEYLN